MIISFLSMRENLLPQVVELLWLPAGARPPRAKLPSSPRVLVYITVNTHL
jgi:hypothetical protein